MPWVRTPSLALGIGGNMNFTLEYLHQQQNDVPDYGIPFAFGAPVPVPRDTYYGLPTDDRTRARDDVLTAKFRDQINEYLWVTDTARLGNYFFDHLQADRTGQYLRVIRVRRGLESGCGVQLA